MTEHMATHVVIPDTQVKPGTPTDHLSWIGNYIADQFGGQPEVSVIHLGDHWDMPALSVYDQRYGRKMEGRRVQADIDAGNRAIELITDPSLQYNRRRKGKAWKPAWHLLRGNHEDRINRAVDANAQVEGLLGMHMLRARGWTVHDFLEPVFLDGVGYAHYWYNPMTGKPIGGMIESRLKTIGHSFTMGHQQTLLYGLRYVGNQSQHGLVAGACYLHDEEYKGPQGNAHWRGIVVCHEVRDGQYDPMFVSLDFLCRKYEGAPLVEFMADTYPDLHLHQ